MHDATAETFDELIGTGKVLVDFWGPRCQPCLALMPEVEQLAHRRADDVTLVKVNATENRQICRDLRVAGLPTYITFQDGKEVERLSGSPTLHDIERAVERLVGGE